MNKLSFGEKFYISDDLERIDQGTNGPIVASESFVEPVPVLASLIQQTPVGSPIVAVAHVDETIVQEAPLGETIIYTDSVGETVSHDGPTGDLLPPPHIDPLSEPLVHEVPAALHAGEPGALLDPNESERLRMRWNEIQGNFVDEPRSAVQQADALVSEVVEKITQMFASERSTLEDQ